MKRISAKRGALNRAVAPWRNDLIERVNRCEFCGRHNVWLVVHEIARGSGLKAKAQDKPYATLVLCDGVNADCLVTCHALMGGKSWAEQLAILKRSRREDFHLGDFHALAGRNYPSADEVDLWLKRLSFISSRADQP